MKKTILIVFLFTITCTLAFGQITTSQTSDWNTVYKSGFYESLVSESSYNNPQNHKGAWFWGINVAHTYNSPTYKYNGQILFRVNTTPTNAPDVFVRSTNSKGEGLWAELLHSKGNHAIDGKLTVKEVEVKVETGADFVFKPDYKLKPLAEVESFVKENQHLPEIPSEKEMIENGVNINEMQIKLLQKIEELTLYIIEQDKKIESLQSEVKALK